MWKLELKKKNVCIANNTTDSLEVKCVRKKSKSVVISCWSNRNKMLAFTGFTLNKSRSREWSGVQLEMPFDTNYWY